MEGIYWHSECAGCASFGIECDSSCEYDNDPNERKCFTSRVEEDPDYKA